AESGKQGQIQSNGNRIGSATGGQPGGGNRTDNPPDAGFRRFKDRPPSARPGGNAINNGNSGGGNTAGSNITPADVKHPQELDQLHGKQDQERQRLEHQQVHERQDLLQKTNNQAQQDQLNQRHEQQLQTLEHKHDSQEQTLRQKQHDEKHKDAPRKGKDDHPK